MTDEPRDQWLREALRHAPDHQMPPPALRDAILCEGRRPLAPAVVAPWWLRMGAWLVRPPVAAGFASVMVMTAAGLLWWDQPVPPMERPAPASAETEVSAAPAAPASPLSQGKPDERKAGGGPQPAAPAVESAARSRRDVQNVPVPPQADTAKERTGEVTRSIPPASGRPTSQALAKQAAGAPASAPARAGLDKVRDAIAAQPGRWTWQRDSGPIRPMDPALLDWISQLDTSTSASWTAAEGEPAGTQALQLRLDGHVVHRWIFSANRVTWFEGSTARHAQLPEPTVRRLREALDGLP